MSLDPPPFDPTAPYQQENTGPPPFNPSASFQEEGSVPGAPATIDESVQKAVQPSDGYFPGIIPFQRADRSKGALDGGDGILGSNIKYTGSNLVDAITGIPKGVYDTMKEGGEALLGRRELTPGIALNSVLLAIGGGASGRIDPHAAISAVADTAGDLGNAVKRVGDVRLAPSSVAPTRQAIKDAAGQAYKAADDAGVIVTPQSFSDFVASTEDQLAKGGIDKTLHPDASAALNRLKAAADSGEPQTLQQIEVLRRVANNARNDAMKEGDARMAGSVVKNIDGFINNLGPDQLVSGDADQAVPALQVARDLWRKNAKMGDIQDILDVAGREDDPNQFIKSKFRTISRNTDRFNQYSPDEQKLITDIAKTGIVDAAGKLAPDLGLTGIAKMGAYGAGALANPAVLALPAAGMAAKYAGIAGRKTNVQNLLDLISSGQPKKGLINRLYLKAPEMSGAGGMIESPEVMGGRAVDHVLSNQADVLDAMTHPNVPGPISFRWGTEKGGFQHIVNDHGEEAARDVPNIIANGKVVSPYVAHGATRINIAHNGKVVSLAPDYFDDPGHWVLTSYDPSVPRLRPKK